MKMIHWGRPLEEQKPQPKPPEEHTNQIFKGGAVVAPPCAKCGTICVGHREQGDIRFVCPNCKPAN